MIVFDEPLAFSDGRSFDRLEVVANPRSHHTVLFRTLRLPAASIAFPTSRARAIGSSSRRRHERVFSRLVTSKDDTAPDPFFLDAPEGEEGREGIEPAG